MMNTTTILFDRYKASLNARSDRRAAMALGVKVQTVSNWRTRGSQAEAATIDAMCKQLKEDAMPWLMRIQAEQGGTDSPNGMVWQRVATGLGVPLTMLLLVVTDRLADGLSSAVNASTNVLALAASIAGSMPIPGI